ncbi:MAG: T9SS type A sorting domain-containing protein [Fidelibacterota bacterium]
MIEDLDRIERNTGFDFIQLREYLMSADNPTGYSNISKQLADSSLELISRWPVRNCDAVAVLDSQHILMGNGDLLQVLDTSNPNDPALIGEVWIEPGTVFEIAVKEPYAYVASGAGLAVVDLSNYSEPTIVGLWDGPNSYFDIILHEGHAYLGGFYALAILDISNPFSPEAIAYIGSSLVMDSAIWQDYLYIGNMEGMSIQIIDISDPSNPQQVNDIYTLYPTDALEVGDGFLYVGSWASPKFRIYDLTDPANPSQVGALYMDREPEEFILEGSLLYTAYNSIDTGFVIIDISDVTSPELVSSLEWTAPAGRSATIRMCKQGSTVFMSEHAGLWSIDVEDISNPEEIGVHWVPGTPIEMEIEFPYLYASSASSGLWILDVSDPYNIQPISNIPVGHHLGEMVLEYPLLYVMGGPITITEIDSVGGLWIFDISNPYNPEVVSYTDSLDFRPYLGALIDLVDTLVFISHQDSGLFVVNVGEPTNPLMISNYPIQGVNGLDAQDTLVYLALNNDYPPENNGIRVINISVPEQPTLVGSYSGGWSTGIKVSGHWAYVAGKVGDSHGLKILSIVHPDSIYEVGSVVTPGVWGGRMPMTHAPPFVYITKTEYPGVFLDVIDVSHVTEPEIIISIEGSRATAFDDIVYVKGNPGYAIYRWYPLGISETQDQQTPNAFHLSQNYPNPFNRFTRIPFIVSERANVELFIYDLLGRTVLKLLDRELKPGHYETQWNTLNDKGEQMPSGIYIVSFGVGSINQARKILYVR